MKSLLQWQPTGPVLVCGIRLAIAGGPIAGLVSGHTCGECGAEVLLATSGADLLGDRSRLRCTECGMKYLLDPANLPPPPPVLPKKGKQYRMFGN